MSDRLAPGSSPAAPPAWTVNTPPPSYRMVNLSGNAFLNLTDGRSFRQWNRKDALQGTAQLDAMEAQMASAPSGATHLVASGSVFEARHGESWLKCPVEHARMLELARDYNMLILSGDIHDNNWATYAGKGDRTLFEATSSGAAVRTGVVIGALQRNYGMLTIDGTAVDIKLFKSGVTQYSETIKRATWK